MDVAQEKQPDDRPSNRNTVSYRAIITAIVVLILCWIGWNLLANWYHDRLLAVERANVTTRLSPFRNTLMTSISRRQALLDGLKALAEMERDPKGLERYFLPYAENIVHDTSGIRALELMPQGVIKYVYPLAGNESALNHNIFNDNRPEVQKDVKRTMKSDTVVISGPLELLQGGRGLVMRKAIYSDGEFWGFATVVLDVPSLLRDAGLLTNYSDVDYVLYRNDDLRLISGDAAVLAQQPVIHSIPLVDGSWSLAGIPIDGWEAQIRSQMLLFQLVGALFGILLGLLAYSIYNRQETLEKAVQQRTEELTSLTEVLQDDIVKQERIEAELLRLNSSMQAVSGVNQAITITHAQDEISLMQEVCRILIEVRGHSLAWIGLVENDKHHTVRPVAQSGFDEGYLESIEITWGNDEHGKGPTGRAIRSKLPVVSHDILNDPLYVPWREEAMRHGFKSSVAIPLMDRGHVFGALNIYSDSLETFDEDELMELQDLATDLSYGVRSLRIREEQWKVESALRESERRYRSLFMDNHAVILLFDPATGQVADANNAASEFYGYTIGQLRGLHIWDINLKSKQELMKRLEIASVKKMPHLIGEHRLANGEIRMVEVYSGPFTIDGRVLIYSLVHDISELRHAEIALAEEKERLAVTLRSIGDGVIATDTNGLVTLINDTASNLTGWDTEKATGRPLQEIFHIIDEETRKSSPNPITRVMRSGKSVMLENHTILVSRSGHEYHIADSAAPILAKDGSIIGVVLVFRDVTEKFAIAEKLRRQQEEYETIFNSVPAMIFYKDLHNHELSVNRAYCEKKGLPLDFKGMHDVEASFPEEDAAEYLHDDLEVARTGIPLRNKIERFYTASGVRWISTDKVPYHDRDGKIIGVIGFAVDITEEKLAREQLETAISMAENANKAKSQFLAVISHEIRTPMNGIMGMTDILLDTPVSSEQKEFLTIIRDSSHSLMEILNDILDHSKINAGKLELDVQPFSLRENVGAFLRSMGFRANQKGLELAGYIAPQIPDILMGDANRLRQILVNIVGNAIKFTDSGEIIVRVELEGSEADRSVVHFSVADTGIGIPAEKIKSIFEEFTQVDAQGSQHYEGSGLGLSIAERIVKMMHGRIWAESKIGEGSTFHFTVELQHQVLDSTQVIPAEKDNLAGYTAFIMANGSTNRDYLGEILTSCGMHVIVVASGKEALAEIEVVRTKGQQISVFILDVDSRDIPLSKLTAELLHVNAAAGAFILLMNTIGNSADCTMNIEPEVVAFLRKPIIQSELLDAVTQAVQQKISMPQLEIIVPSAIETPHLKILLAEDNAVNQLVARKMLEKMGHDVILADDGGETLRIWREQSPDLILMDIQMPNTDGFETTRLIRAEEYGKDKHVPIIAITANAMKEDNERCLAAGMDGYIAKPVNMERLRMEILRVIAEYQE